jgi:hypothetical protein
MLFALIKRPHHESLSISMLPLHRGVSTSVICYYCGHYTPKERSGKMFCSNKHKSKFHSQLKKLFDPAIFLFQGNSGRYRARLDEFYSQAVPIRKVWALLLHDWSEEIRLLTGWLPTYNQIMLLDGYILIRLTPDYSLVRPSFIMTTLPTFLHKDEWVITKRFQAKCDATT